MTVDWRRRERATGWARGRRRVPDSRRVLSAVGAIFQSARRVGRAHRPGTDRVTNLIRRELAAIDPELPSIRHSDDERARESLAGRSTDADDPGARLSRLWRCCLAAIGIYGVLAYQVGQRTREIGIRMALGAATSSIFGMVLREGAMIVSIGVALGLAGAFLLRQTLQSQLYEIGAMDPTVIATVAGVLLAVALTACLLPARKAARTDPVVALTVQ